MSIALQIVPAITDIRTIKPFHSVVTIEPFERGLGHTLGNALRRVMMSAIPGFAVTEVKIEGVVHEYDHIEGMREDVIWMILNLKKVAFKIHDEDSAVIRVNKTGPCTVTAGDLELPHNVEVLNPAHVLANLTGQGPLDMEITVEKGVGYEAASSRDYGEGKRFGVIYPDASYSPVERVSFQVESTRVDNRTDLDRLVINIETNGIYTAEEMIEMSAGLLIGQLNVFANVEEKRTELGIAGGGAEAQADLPILSEEVATMDLTVRSQNCLRQEHIRYIGELVRLSEKILMKTPHLGKKSLLEIKSVLAGMGLSFGMEVPDWTPPAKAEWKSAEARD